MSDEALEALDRLEENYRLLDPDTAAAEVSKIVSEELRRAGVNVDDIRQKNRVDAETFRQKAFEAGRKFMRAHPEYKPTRQNEKKMFQYLTANNLSFTLTGYEDAFAVLKRDLDLKPTQPKHTAPQVVNGIRITREELDKLSAREMATLMQIPRFVEAVNTLPPRTR